MEIDSPHEDSTFNPESSSDKGTNLRVCLLNHLLECENVCVKSEQIGEPELNRNEKQKILEQILDRSHSTFLSRFGHHLHPEHLSYFSNPSDDESYEVQFYLNKLGKKKPKLSDVLVKNRRFEAMKRLMSEGEYFSVSEMRKRNPLLFDQLLGNFVKNPKTEINQDQKYQVAHILLDQFEQDQIALLKKSQLEEEMKEIDECISSDDERTNESKETSSKMLITSADEDEIGQVLWGSTYKGDDVIGRKRWKDKHGIQKPTSSENQNLSQEEKLLLINEFTSSMFNNFLEGKDEFDYSEVDNNPEYDDMKQCEIDEQDKYFDSESPQEAIDCNNSEEDELDRFMKEVDHQIETENLADKIKNMNPQESVKLKN